jgi:predicted dehydrogenase
MKKPIDIVLIGAGSRGRNVYGLYIRQHPKQFRLVAVADPNATRREITAAQHSISPEGQFASWEDLLARPQFAQAAIIATPDQAHTGPALAALRAGYDVLLEKPMSHRQIDCITLVQTAEQMGRLLQICHVLRYTPLMQQIKGILESGLLGDIITIAHRENVSFWHMAHSYVRGNWRNTAQSSPMILAKCSHDFDLLYWLLESKCERLASIGSLRHFRSDQAPVDAPKRCTDGCPIADICPYEATHIYVHLHPFIAELSQTKQPLYRAVGRLAASKIGQMALNTLSQVVPPLRLLRNYHGWPRSIISDEPGEAAIRHALETGPYGRCVYYCDNDVVDHQVVMMEFKGGISATLTMHGHSHREGRTMRIDGTRATLFAHMHLFESEIEIHHKRSGRVDRRYIPHGIGQGHGGGDASLMRAFFRALINRQQPPLTTARASLESHLLAFAADEARLTGKMIHMDAYRAQAWAEVNAHSSIMINQPLG